MANYSMLELSKRFKEYLPLEGNAIVGDNSITFNKEVKFNENVIPIKNIVPNSDSVSDLGSLEAKWNNIYANNLSIGDNTINQNGIYGINLEVTNLKSTSGTFSDIVDAETLSCNNISVVHSEQNDQEATLKKFTIGYYLYDPTVDPIKFSEVVGTPHFRIKLNDTINIFSTGLEQDTRIIGGGSPGRIILHGDSVHTRNYADSAPVAMHVSNLVQSSSLRYKENINDISLEEANKIYDVNVVTFNYKDDDSHKETCGVIAEQLQEIGLTLPIFYDDNNEPESVSYVNLVPYLIKAIQEQNKTINSLQDQINQLNSTISLLVEEKTTNELIK